MSKNRNRTKLKKTETNRAYNIKYKHYRNDYCFICAKRSGNFYADCSPGNLSARGRHGSGKPVYSHKAREYKTWKYNRKTKYKTKNNERRIR